MSDFVATPVTVKVTVIGRSALNGLPVNTSPAGKESESRTPPMSSVHVTGALEALFTPQDTIHALMLSEDEATPARGEATRGATDVLDTEVFGATVGADDFTFCDGLTIVAWDVGAMVGFDDLGGVAAADLIGDGTTLGGFVVRVGVTGFNGFTVVGDAEAAAVDALVAVTLGVAVGVGAANAATEPARASKKPAITANARTISPRSFLGDIRPPSFPEIFVIELLMAHWEPKSWLDQWTAEQVREKIHAHTHAVTLA